MNEHVIDCCSLINLYTGWRGLAPLGGLSGRWYVCDAVFIESEYTREFDEHGETAVVPIDLGPDVQAGVLDRVRPESDEELADYVNFATELDDGEAQALAIAKNRGFTVLTDDKKAQRLATEIGVGFVSTPSILRDWADGSPENTARLPEIVRRITLLARFTPPTNSPDYDWWRTLFEDGA